MQGTKMCGAIVGFGIIATGHLAAYQKISNITICAVVDPVPECRQRALQLAPNINTYSTIEELFASETLDFIDICSPPFSHNEYIRTALRHDCHVLCEKPFLLSSQEYNGILDHSSQKIVYPSHNYKFSPIILRMSECLQSTSMGEPLRGHFRTMRKGHAKGVAEWAPDWRRNAALAGGGILFDHGPHSIYIASQMCSKHPKAVSCIMGKLNPIENFATEDTALLSIDFGGIIWEIDLIWNSPRRNSFYAVHTDKGSVIVENDKMVSVSKDDGYRETHIVSEFDDPLHVLWYQSMFMDFIDATKNPSRQNDLLIEALTCSLVIEAAQKSVADNGCWTNVPLPSAVSFRSKVSTS